MTATAEGTLTELSAAYRRDGYFRFPYRFHGESVRLLRERVSAISRQRRPEVVHEKDTDTVRAVHGCHAFDDLCRALVRHPRLVALAEALLGGPVYTYQFKVNLKRAREGAAWPWHQDFSFWREEDGMARPDAVNIAVPLDAVHPDNGPLVVIPTSHTLGLLDLPENSDNSRGDWRQHVSANLAYTVKADRAEELMRQRGRKPILGPAGSIHVFHPSIVHSSSNNTSSDGRALLLITYNRVDNAPKNPTRPEFLVSRDSTAIVPHPDDRLRLVPEEPEADPTGPTDKAEARS
ncbi:phytanoyl-CoA dioxygenase family protein [Streptomyces macrosporus]|uniref:Phytanoyl-CoA dioxygenase family protein n=1 Tax=Streptomyces macrosporus TaxID=44032 RepID=A0ABN3KIN0_9ACTN